MHEKDIFDSLAEQSTEDKSASGGLFELSQASDILNGQASATLELSEKDDALRELFDIDDDIDDENALLNMLDATIGADIEKAVKDIFKNNRRDIGSAQRKIRACIENYCRYNKGIDLNDGLFFSGESIFHKLKVVDIDADKIDRIASIYKSTNGFIHDDLKALSIAEAKLSELIRAIIGAAEDLHEWGFDKVDIKAGVAHLYTTKDRRLLYLLDNKVADINLVSEKELQHHFDKMRDLEDFMREHGIAIPDIKFKNQRDIEDYRFDKKIQSQNGKMSSSDYAQLFARNQERSNNGDFSACLWMAEQPKVSVDKAISLYLFAMRTKDAADKMKATATATRVRIAKILFDGCYYNDAMKWLDGLTSPDSAVCLEADCYYKANKHDEAFAKYRSLPISSLAEDWRKKFVAERLFESDPATAKEYYRQCQAANSTDIIKLIGDCCMAEGNIDEAIREYEKIIACKYSNEYKYKMADIFANRVSYSQIVRIFPSRKQIVACEIADLLWEYYDRARAIDWYEKCDMDDISSERQLDLANYYLKVNNVARAVNYFSKYISLTKDYFAANAVARYLWQHNHENEAISFFSIYASETQDAYTFKLMGDYYKKHNMMHRATECYSSYITISKDYDFARTIAKELWAYPQIRDLVIVLYEKIASGVGDVEITKFLCDYYKAQKNLSKELVWYEKYYRLGNEKNEEVIQHIIQINMTLNRVSDALRWKKVLADLLFARGKVDVALELYNEYLNTHYSQCDRGLVLRLAEYYYFNNLYREAEKMLSKYAQCDVLVDHGVAFCSDGSFFIHYNEGLIHVTKKEISCLATKHNAILKRTSAELRLNSNAYAGLPKKIKLFDNLPDNQPIVVKIKEKVDQDRRLAKEKKRTKKPKNHYKQRRIGTVSLRESASLLLAMIGVALGIILEISYVIYYTGCSISEIESIASSIAWGIPSDDSLLFWLYVGGIPFIINAVAALLSKKSIFAFPAPITLVVQYMINLVYQGWVWLDPNDGELCWLEFIECGIWLPLLSACIFGAIFFFVLKKKSRF